VLDWDCDDESQGGERRFKPAAAPHTTSVITHNNSYVMQRSDPALLSWWARHCEAQGSFAKALHCYQRTGELRLCAWGATRLKLRMLMISYIV